MRGVLIALLLASPVAADTPEPPAPASCDSCSARKASLKKLKKLRQAVPKIPAEKPQEDPKPVKTDGS